MSDLNTILLEEDLDKVIVSEVSPFFKTRFDASGRHQWFNPTDQHLRQYGYLPTIDIVSIKSKFGRGYFTERVVIQSSASKAVHGSNYFGSDEKDYDPYIRWLVEKSKLVGLPFTTDQLEAATLRNCSLCFNFYLPDDFPYPYEFLKKVSFLDVGKRHREVKNTNFVEETAEGYAGRLYNGQVGFVLYDKRAELLNNAKTLAELKIVERIQRGELPDKVLRMEVNLQNQKAVKQHLTTRLGGDKGQARHLRDISDKLEQGILTDALEKLTDEVDVTALEMPLYPVETAYELCRKSGMSNSEAERWLGRSCAIQQVGSLNYKKLQDRHYPRQSRYYLRESHKKVFERSPLPRFTLSKIFEECRRQLAEFKVLKPATPFLELGKFPPDSLVKVKITPQNDS